VFTTAGQLFYPAEKPVKIESNPMLIPENIIANADDLGLNPSVSHAILYCYEQQYINSASLMTSTPHFEHAVDLIASNPVLKNIGIHTNFTEGKPLTNMPKEYLDEDGNWNKLKIKNKYNIVSSTHKEAFAKELDAQIQRAVSSRVALTHLDSHHHIHTLPSFHTIFLQAAKKFNLKLRLAQTFNKGNLLNYCYRKYVNSTFKGAGLNYSDYFEDVHHYIREGQYLKRAGTIEIMFHPGYTEAGSLLDHYDVDSLSKWTEFLTKELIYNYQS